MDWKGFFWTTNSAFVPIEFDETFVFSDCVHSIGKSNKLVRFKQILKRDNRISRLNITRRWQQLDFQGTYQNWIYCDSTYKSPKLEKIYAARVQLRIAIYLWTEVPFRHVLRNLQTDMKISLF